MASDWKIIGNLASTAGLGTFALTGAKGIVAGYQAFASPYTSLTESERKLEKVRSRLQGLSPQRREEIETAIRSNPSGGCKSLGDLEKKLQECVLLIDAVSFAFKLNAGVSSLLDQYYRLSEGYEEVTFAERHLPRTLFRKQVSALVQNAKALLNDNMVKFLIQLVLRSESHYTHCASENDCAILR